MIVGPAPAAPALRRRLERLGPIAGLAIALSACGGRGIATAHADAPPQLAVGEPVLASQWAPIRVHPDPGAAAVARALPGAPGRLEDQAVGNAGQAWWRVAFDDGSTGWLPATELQAVRGARVKAFPSAEGFGAAAEGGRGGRVIEVTNLGDHGPGSLREALTAAGPRTVVFRVGGTIRLRSGIPITEPYLTIAGQTAPGGGIAIRNDPANSDAPIVIQTHDVIIRFLRVRPGPSEEPSCCLDALQIGKGARRVIIDHCSFSWAVDELLDAWYDAREITVQWSILAEALNRSSHQKGRHSRGLLFGGPDGGDYTIHHNLFAHNAQRNPLIAPGRGVADIVNNVIYDPQSRVSHVENTRGPVLANYVGNYFKAGRDTNSPTLPNYALDAIQRSGGHGRFRLFVAGNYDQLHRTDDGLPEDAILEPADRAYVVEARQPAPLVRTTSAARAFEEVLARAGATVPARDPVDLRIVNGVRATRGRLVNDPRAVGGWPTLEPGTPPPDADRDGMPDAWETGLGLDPEDAADRNGDLDGDGYTNLEAYLNQLAGDVAAAVAEP